jgi:hypothetical protein
MRKLSFKLFNFLIVVVFKRREFAVKVKVKKLLT